MWITRRLKTLGAQTVDLVDLHVKQIRSILELDVPAWAGAVTKAEKKDIERIQKTAIKIITGEHDNTYEESLKLVNLETLEKRREDLCLEFAIKCVKNENHTQLFKRTDNALLHYPPKFEPPFCHHERYKKYPIPYLTDLLNKHYSKSNNG